jgi:23S rRNA (cytidine1920-2'-O)/16S rRNA (cytidine1409-2'-O)-methyltransferase
MVTEGRVLANGAKTISPAQEFLEDVKIYIRGEKKYVGRGAEKLAAAIKEFGIQVKGKICADIGAATGGFTQVLLQNDAKEVYAIDTAKGKLDFSLREDQRVIVMEECDVRDLQELPELPEFVTIDVSLISLRDILPAVRRVMDNTGEVVALFKPQYEARDMTKLKHGIVTDDYYRESLLKDFVVCLEANSWKIAGTMVSPIRGSKGNVEYLLYLRR